MNDEHSGAWASAARNYQEALKLDPDTGAARDGVTRAQAKIAADEFATAMSRGAQLLEAGSLQEARASFERAGRIRPNAQEVTEALAQVAQAEQRRQIEAHRQSATSLERAERWTAALAEYDAALKLDPTLEFAHTARARVLPRVELAQQLDQLLAKPERLFSVAVREQAHALLAQARAIVAASNKAAAGGAPAGPNAIPAAPQPVLQGQIDKLTAALAQAETPVRVALESDSATDVVIHRFGHLGIFLRREVELLPGTYTVMGTRQGFRDVRQELTVLPGQTPPALVVRCEERI
jgi:tetratricopeptide (TPR) repeat protein